MSALGTINHFGNVAGTDRYGQRWDNSAAYGAKASMYGADQGTEQARIGAEASKFPHILKQQRFDTLWPWLQGQFGNLQNELARAGGQSGASPEITVGGVWNPQQVNQQVNATRAQNDMAAQSQMKQQAQKVGGMGFGSNSPLLQALQGQTQAANLATNTQAEQQFRNQAAQLNAEHLFNTQQGRENQFASRQREDIERRKPIWSGYNTLLGSLVGLA